MKILVIPSLWICVKTYERSEGNGQDIIDKEDSAVMWNWGRLTVIADHSHQGNFSNLNKAVPYSTRLFVVGGGIKRYICNRSEIGYIKTSVNGNRLYNANWESVYHLNMDGLIVYTCVKRVQPDVMGVRLTYWNEVKN